MSKKKMIFIISAIIFIIILFCVISISLTNSKNAKNENNITDLTTNSNISESVKSTTQLTTITTTASNNETKLTTTKKEETTMFYEESQNTSIYDFSSNSVGDTIEFGYGFSWKILAKESDKILVISENSIGFKQFDDDSWKDDKVTWEECTLRQWISDFYGDIFGDEENSMILTTKVINSKVNEFGESGGNDTYDKFFLLSVDEAEKYFKTDEDRIYFEENSNYYLTPEDLYCAWWLRDPGMNNYYMSAVTGAGYISHDGFKSYDSLAVRPAMWLKIK